MNNPAHDCATVEMRGLKAALVARAQTKGVSVSSLVKQTHSVTQSLSHSLTHSRYYFT